jgi:uncharacterized protein with HEPN domain
MERDATYLVDMLEAARLAIRYVAAVPMETFMGDVQCQDAVIRRLEIVGEAARRVSPAFREASADIPWRSIIGMRNALIHEYDGVDLFTVWQTIKVDLPIVIERLEQLLK